MARCSDDIDKIKHDQSHFHRRMRKRSMKHCEKQREEGLPEDPILSLAQRNGVTMSTLRRLQEIALQNTTTGGTNRNFGILQDVSTSHGHALQGVIVSAPRSNILFTPVSNDRQRPSSSQLPFPICEDQLVEGGGGLQEGAGEMPWGRFEGLATQTKENARLIEKWSDVKVAQKPGSVKRQPVPFSIYSEVRCG